VETIGDLMKKPEQLILTRDPRANAFIAADPLAFLIGLVLHQQVTTEKAFSSPLALRDRLGEELDAGALAAMEPESLEALFKAKPALHRFPGAMAKRVQDVCEHLTDLYGGNVMALWADVNAAAELMDRLLAIPGFGEYKARIYLGVLGRRFEVQPEGWEDYAPTWPSIADVETSEDLEELKVRKKARKESQA
jgi:uncharacterized HhH-GPD family protein